MAVTLKQIAARTGMSVPTVHQILNGYPAPFAEATRKKVLAAAAAMNYQPNITARSLTAQRSFLIGVLFYGSNFPLVTPFMRGVQESVKANRCAPLFFTHESLEEELENLQSAMERRVDGLIVNAAVGKDSSTNSARFEAIKQKGTPFVEVFGRFIKGVPNISLDYRGAGIAATELLIAEGHERIALLNRDGYLKTDRRNTRSRFWTATDLWQGYQVTMKAAGLSTLVCDYSPTAVHNGYSGPFIGANQAVPELFSDPARSPTAVICYSERAAEGLIRFLELMSPAPPKPITVVIFSQFQSDIRADIKVISLPFPIFEAGRQAADALFTRIANGPVNSVSLFPIAVTDGGDGPGDTAMRSMVRQSEVK